MAAADGTGRAGRTLRAVPGPQGRSYSAPHVTPYGGGSEPPRPPPGGTEFSPPRSKLQTYVGRLDPMPPAAGARVPQPPSPPRRMDAIDHPALATVPQPAVAPPVQAQPSRWMQPAQRGVRLTHIEYYAPDEPYGGPPEEYVAPSARAPVYGHAHGRGAVPMSEAAAAGAALPSARPGSPQGAEGSTPRGLSLVAAATVIQAIVRGFLTRCQVLPLLAERRRVWDLAAYVVMEDMVDEVMLTDFIPAVLVEVFTDTTNAFADYPEAEKDMRAVVDDLVADVVPSLVTVAVKSVIQEFIDEYMTNTGAQRIRHPLVAVCDDVIEDTVGDICREIVTDAMTDMVNEYLFMKDFDSWLSEALHPFVHDVAYSVYNEQATAVLYNDIEEQVLADLVKSVAREGIRDERDLVAKLNRYAHMRASFEALTLRALSESQAANVERTARRIVHSALFRQLAATMATHADHVAKQDMLKRWLHRMALQHLLRRTQELDQALAVRDHAILEPVRAQLTSNMLSGILLELVDSANEWQESFTDQVEHLSTPTWGTLTDPLVAAATSAKASKALQAETARIRHRMSTVHQHHRRRPSSAGSEEGDTVASAVSTLT